MPVRVNMATSLDGKIAPATREKVRLGTDADIARMDMLRGWADVIVLGAGTARAEDPPMEVKDQALIRDRESEGRPSQPAVAVLSNSLDLVSGRLFRSEARHIVVTNEEAPEPGDELARSVEIWRIGKTAVDTTALLERFGEEGMERVLVEGGGRLTASFLAAGLVDELFVTVTPWLIGGHDAPGLAMAGQAFEPPIEFVLESVEADAEEIFLRYRRAGKASPG